MADITPDPLAWHTFALDVGDGHQLHVELAGNPDGLPVVCLHGGPASGLSVAHRRFVDPARYHIVQFDQRGCGRSTPRGATAHNTTAHLIADIERLREHLGIARWLVLGGSWGATLGLAYAAAHRAACAGLVLRGLFFGSRADVQQFFDGHRSVSPAAHDLMAALAPTDRRSALADWIPRTLLGDDAPLQANVARAWQAWEAVMDGAPVPDLSIAEHPETLAARVDKYRVQAHYLAHGCFLDDGWWRAAAGALGDLPVAILHGVDDRICPVANSRAVHAQCANSVLVEVPGCRHNPFAADMLAAIRAATDTFAHTGAFAPIG